MKDEWIESLASPGTAFPKIAKKANLVGGLQHVAVGYLINGILTFIAVALFGTMLGGALGMTAGIGFGIVTMIVGIIFGIILSLIGAGLIWIVAKLLGGTGEYGTQYHLTSAPLAAVLIIQGVLSFIPFLGAIIGGLISIYYLYPLTLAIKEAHKFSTLKAVAAWAIPAIVVLILAVAFAGIATLAMIGVLGAMGEY